MENHHFLMGKSTTEGQFSMVFCMFTRPGITLHEPQRFGKKLLNMAIEIVDLPMKNGDVPLYC